MIMFVIMMLMVSVIGLLLGRASRALLATPRR